MISIHILTFIFEFNFRLSIIGFTREKNQKLTDLYLYIASYISAYEGVISVYIEHNYFYTLHTCLRFQHCFSPYPYVYISLFLCHFPCYSHSDFFAPNVHLACDKDIPIFFVRVLPTCPLSRINGLDIL